MRHFTQGFGLSADSKHKLNTTNGILLSKSFVTGGEVR